MKRMKFSIWLRKLRLNIVLWFFNNFKQSTSFYEESVNKMRPKQYKKLSSFQKTKFLEDLNIQLIKKEVELREKSKVTRQYCESLISEDKLNWFVFHIIADFRFQAGRHKISTVFDSDMNESFTIENENLNQEWCDLMRWVYQEIEDKRLIFDLKFIWFSIELEIVEREDVECN